MPSAKSRTLISWRSARHAAVVGLLAFACNSSTPPDDDTLVATSLVVEPSSFLGQNTCLDAAGALRSYQATLIDVSPDLEAPFALASSEILSCKSTAYFGYVTPGRRYTAYVEAFDQPSLRARTPGLRVVIDEDGKTIHPRWTTTCRGDDGVSYGGASGQEGEGGQSALGIEALLNARVSVRGCAPLVDSETLGPTGVSISIEQSLLDLRCGDDPGDIASFKVRGASEAPPGEGNSGGQGGQGGDSGGPTPPSDVTACSDSLTILDLVPGTGVKYLLDVYESGQSVPSYATTCRAFTVAGVVVPANCEPLEAL